MGTGPWQFDLTRPLWLAALAVLPVLLYSWARTLVHFPRRQRAVSLAVRTLLVVLVVVSLCGPRLSGTGDRVEVVALVDTSESVSPQAPSPALGAFREEAAKHGDKADFSALWFAGETGKLRLEGEKFEDAATARRATNIARAIAAARATIPADRVGHIVLFSDGNPTTGDAVTAAKAAGVPISVVPLSGCDPEVQVVRVVGPDQVRQGEAFHLEVVVHSTQEEDATLELLCGSASVLKEKKHLVKGENRFYFLQTAGEGPAAVFVARVEDCRDTIAQNNQAGCVVQVGPRPRVLVVENRRVLAEDLKAALEKENIVVEVVSPQDLSKPEEQGPTDRLQQYELVVLSNLLATSIPAEWMKAIQDYVRAGGGLIVVGGDQSFTAGGYRGTALEEVLPVISEASRERPKPTMAMVLVADVSLSMKGRSIELAKEALRGAVKILSDRDQVGILAFEDRSRWIVPLGKADKKQPILKEIETIEAGGGTNMYPAMEQAYLALREAYADLKHIIVLTDGVSSPGDYDALAKTIAASGITVSMVGVGREPARPLLQGMAEKAKGRSHFVDDAAALPEVFARETRSATRMGITESPFVPRVVRWAQALRGLDFAKAPTLLGYVETQARPESHVVLKSEFNEPILAWWRHGKGTSVAFTSDIQSRWAGTWLRVAPNLFQRFWTQLVRQAMRKETAPSCVLHVEAVGGGLDVALDAADSQGRFINGVRPLVTVTDPEGKTREVSLDQVAPGRYAARVAACAAGAYQLEARVSQDGQPIAVRPRGVVATCDDELRIRPTNMQLLRAIAEISGGHFKPQPAEVFSPADRTAPRTVSVWPYLLLAAVLVFVVDLALKRVEWRA